MANACTAVATCALERRRAIEFFGRGDDQVKVRGYRVEIGEVENALSLLPGVESAVVLAQAVHNSQRLQGYCVVPGLDTAQSAARSRELLAALRAVLPEYMVPSALVVMDAFPRNVSGKIDRKRLPAPQAGSDASGQPETAVEALLCRLMASVLKLEQVGVEDDFFAVGGDSISAIMLCTELRREGYALRPSAVFAQRTPRHMAEALTANAATITQASVWQLSTVQHAALALRYGAFAGASPLLPLQKGMLFHAQLGDGSGNYNAHTRLHFNGALDAQRLRRSLDAVLTRYPQLGGLFDAETGDEPVFLLPASAQAWPWHEHDLSELGEQGRLERLHAIEQSLLAQHYPTDRYAGMLAATLVRMDSQRHVLILVIHHLLIDGWSTPLLLRDVLTAYTQSLAQLPPPQADYLTLMAQLAQRDQSDSAALWRDTLAGVQPTLLFEQAPAGAPVQEFSLVLPVALSAQLTAELRRRALTLNVLMQGAWAMALTL